VSLFSSSTESYCRALDRRRRRGELPVALCIDAEPDVRLFPRDEPRPWSGFEGMLDRLPPLREKLAEATGSPVALSWFLRMDPQVAETWGSPGWVAEAYGERLEELLACGDELALHTHTWRWSASEDTWLADYADHSWARQCLSMGLEAFTAAFRRPCRAHRGGDHLLSGALLAELEAADVEVDLSIEPGWPAVSGFGDSPTAGALPDYRGVPLTPYRSSPRRFPLPDPEGTGPLLMPLFSPPALRRRQRLPLPPDSRHFVSRLALEMTREPPMVLALVLRSEPGALASWDRITANLEHLARHRGVRFLTATAAARSITPAWGGALSGAR
jgi:hypothetical protein